MMESAEDLLLEMNWVASEMEKPQKRQQRQLEFVLSEPEQEVYNLLNGKNGLTIDALSSSTEMNSSVLAATLLEMEMNSILIALPGKRYKLL